MRTRLYRCAGLLAAAVSVLLARPADAHRRDFITTYQWWTPAPTEKEIEPALTYSPDERKWKGALEFEYGMTERWAIAPYVLYEQSPGSRLKINGWKLEQRYRLGLPAENRVLPALYAEVKKENGEPYELETKLILAHYGFLSSAVNLIAEREMASHEPVKWGYAAGTSWSPAKRWQIGVEAWGNLTEREHFVGPTVGFDALQSVRILVGAGLGLNHDSPGHVKMLAEYEWF